MPKRSRQNHVRFTSNVLRSMGLAIDAICLAASVPIAYALYDVLIGEYYDTDLHVTGAIVLAINFFLVRISRNAYSMVASQGDDVGQGAVVDFTVAATLTLLTVIQFGVLIDLSRGLSLLYFVSCLILFVVSSLAFRKLSWWLMKLGYIGQRVVIYGADQGNVNRVIELLEIERLSHIRVIGFADDRRTRVATDRVGSANFIGGCEELLEMARSGEIDQVIIALPKLQQERLDNIVEQLSAVAVDVCILPREILEFRSRYRINFIGSLPVLNLWQQPVRDLDGVVKEIQDRTLSLIGIIVCLPIFIITAIAIRLESPGPVIFIQRRFGFNNLEIGVFKFRSMYHDKSDVSGAARTTKEDARVTRVGRIIRRLSIDELPQLFNVLRGEMSLVGPRPHATAMMVGDHYYFDAVKGYGARHRVKPGITGLAQVRGLRGEISTVERAKRRVEYDIYYIEHWSPLLDIRIIIETMFKLIWDRHAY